MDNAATSYPKPDIVYSATDTFARHAGGSGGRGGHSKTIEASCYLDGARESLARLLGAPMPECVCFAPNATEALNLAVYGLAKPGCRIVSTSMEHNSVWRPLTDLRIRFGCRLHIVQAGKDGFCHPNSIIDAVDCETEFVVMNHASNVTGTIQDVESVAKACRSRKVPLVVDAAQTAGAYPFNMLELGVSAIAFTGHKSLLGPQGTGGLIVDPEGCSIIQPLKRGGTGSRSESEHQPDFLPDRFESGTLNGHGIAGLGAGAQYLLSHGVSEVRKHEMSLWRRFREGLREMPHIKVYGPEDADRSVGIISLTVEGMEPTDIGFLLDVRHGIMTRTGLHCAPLAHQTLGTAPFGTVRFSLGFANTSHEVDLALDGLARIREKAHQGRAA
jgi:cysteine desulfurase family protein